MMDWNNSLIYLKSNQVIIHAFNFESLNDQIRYYCFIHAVYCLAGYVFNEVICSAYGFGEQYVVGEIMGFMEIS